MNNIFRVIWNKSTQSWVAVSELARGQVKSSTTSNVDVKKSKIAVSVMGALALASAVEVQAATVVNTAAVNAGNIYIETNAGTTNNVLIGKTATVSSTGHYDVVVIGKNSQAQGPSAIAIGSTSKAKGDAVAIGLNANSSANYSVSIGKNAASKAEGGISIGHGANVTSTGVNSTAIGAGSKASNTNATALGSGAIASNKSATAIGHSANASNINATAIGVASKASRENATAIGTNATASNTNATALGTNATASNANATAIGTNASASLANTTALGVNASASNTNATAIGINSVASSNNATALGPHANASAANSTAIGPGAIAKGGKAVALGVGALANATSALALGENATVNIQNSVAIGKDSKAEGQGDLVAIGTNATAGARGTIALGKDARTSSDRAVAIGQNASATQSDAFAAGTNATGAGSRSITIGNNAETTTAAADGIALGSNVSASGSAAIAIGKRTKATAEVALAMVDGANASGPKSIAIGQNSQSTKSQAVAIGATSKATANDALALGSSAVASHANSVALGSNSETNDPAAENSNTFYTFNDDSGAPQRADFAANRVRSIVSVGAANAERQIHHVGAGRISENSTDAINGSQLYHVLNKSGFNVLNGTTSVSRINNNGKVAFTDGNYTTVEVDKIDNTTNTAKIKYNVKTQDIASENATAIPTLSATPEDAGLATAATVVAAINKAGFKVGVNKDNETDTENIVNGDTLLITNKDENIEVSRTGKKIEIGITETPTFKNVSIVNSNGGNRAKAENISAKKGAGNVKQGDNEQSDRLVYTDSAGTEQPIATMNDGLKFTGNNENETNSHKLNSVVKIVGERDDDKTAYDDDSAKNNIIVQADGDETLTVKLAKDLVNLKSVTTEDAEGNKSVVNGKGITITPFHRSGDVGSLTGTGNPVSLTNTGLNNGGNVITNVAGHLPGAVTNHAAPETYGELPDWEDREIGGDRKSDAATVGDVLHAGWNLKGPQKVADAEDKADHVDFVRAYDSVKFKHGKNTRVTVAKDPNKDVEKNGITYNESNIKFDVDLPVAYTDQDGNTLALGENGEYYKVDGDGNILEDEGPVNKDSIKISLLNPDTKQGANDQTGEPVTLTNLKDNIGDGDYVLPQTEGSPFTKDDFDKEKNGHNAATVNDVLNAGWNAYVDDTEEGNFKALVNPTDKVVFKGEDGVTVSADQEADGVTTFKFSSDFGTIGADDATGAVNEVAEDNKVASTKNVAETIAASGWKLTDSDGHDTIVNPGNTVTYEASDTITPVVTAEDDNPTITFNANTTELTPIAEGTDNAGSISEPSEEDGKKLVNATTVAAAINNAGFTLKASAVQDEGTRDTNSTKDENGELINSGDTVEMIAGKNLSVKHDADGKITYATKENVEFTSVQFGTSGPKIQKDDNDNLKVSGSDDTAPVHITNLKNNIGGDATDVPHTAGQPLTKPDNFDAETNGRNAATVNDVLNAGWNAYVNDTTDGNFKALVNPTDKVVFKGENGVVVTAEEEDQGVTTFNFSVNTTALQGSSPITYVNENGDKLIKTPDNKFYKAEDIVNGKPKEDAEEQTPAGHKLVDNDGNVTTPSTLGNVAGTLTPSYNKGNPKVADGKADKDDEAQVGEVTKQVI
ncbi:hypothetical protein JFL47_05970, partial [Haemophilus haemoglobinophilus]|nr:hypothetical protein [Canicola haemoglobinophilus]